MPTPLCRLNVNNIGQFDIRLPEPGDATKSGQGDDPLPHIAIECRGCGGFNKNKWYLSTGRSGEIVDGSNYCRGVSDDRRGSDLLMLSPDESNYIPVVDDGKKPEELFYVIMQVCVTSWFSVSDVICMAHSCGSACGDRE